MPPQVNALKQGVDVLSATPGRLLDHVYEGRIDFGALEVLVLDEADRMMDMGFLPDINRIISLLPPKRQNLIFSATIPPDIQKLAEEICHHPVRVRVGASTKTATGIRHAVYPVSEEQKTELLVRLLKGSELSSVIVFTRTKIRADRLARSLFQKGVQVAAIHGDRSQGERIRALERFKDGNIQVLVATDVASRGIDVKDVSHVINFDVPQSPEDYIHRSGRTARAEAEGDAFTLMAPEEEEMIGEIEAMIEQKLPRVTLPDFQYRKGESHARGGHRPGGHGHGGHSGGGHRRPASRGSSHGRSSHRPTHR
jgi:ATP-dependent RNA helicase RhlE